MEDDDDRPEEARGKCDSGRVGWNPNKVRKRWRLRRGWWEDGERNAKLAKRDEDHGESRNQATIRW